MPAWRANNIAGQSTSINKTMSDSSQPPKGKKIPRQPPPEGLPEVRSKSFDEVSYGYTPVMAMLEASRCLQCKKPKCVMGCPVHVAIPELGSGDYEGITTDGKKIYVAESNGNIYKFELESKGKIHKLKKYNTALKKNNDAEGLAYDPITDQLFIACKGDAGIRGEKKKGRAIYRFDLDKKEIKNKAAFNISRDDIKAYLEENKDFEYEANRINFKPSGIALHPINDHFYIIASIGKLLLITDRKGHIKGSMPLDPRLLGQPEGICFAPNGDLFISSEGQGDKGYILKFNMN